MSADDKTQFDPLSQLGSAEQIYLWIDNFCRANPLETVPAGAAQLYGVLEEKARKC